MTRSRPTRLAPLVLLVACWMPAAASAHHGSLFGAQPSQADLAGLRPADPLGICRGEGYEIVVDGEADGCTHGPDPASAFGLWGASSAGPPATGGTAARCIGDGASGPRVQMIYARIAGTAGAYGQTAPLLQDWAVAMNEMMRGGAAETGGARDIRFVTDASCRAVIADGDLGVGAIEHQHDDHGAPRPGLLPARPQVRRVGEHGVLRDRRGRRRRPARAGEQQQREARPGALRPDRPALLEPDGGSP